MPGIVPGIVPIGDDFVTSGIIRVTSGWNSAPIWFDGASRQAVKFATARGADVTLFATSR